MIRPAALAALLVAGTASLAWAQPQAEDPHGDQAPTGDAPIDIEHEQGHSEHAGDEHAGEHHGPQPPPPINWTKVFGRGNVDAHGDTLEPGEETMFPPLALALFNFAVFAALLVWKAGPPIRRYVANRHTTIKEALAEAASLRDAARRKLEEYTKRAAEADAEVSKLIAELRSDAEAERKRIVDEARAQAETIKRTAEGQIDATLARAKVELEREVVARAIEIAEATLRTTTTAADQSNLINAFIVGISPRRSGSTQPPGVTDKVDEEWS